jgi:predicted SprT family Zn-dependent metalloprotease
MNDYGLIAEGWTFKFDRAKRRFGCCHHSTKTISLSEPLVELNEPYRVINTILHEIAHALVGTENGHNAVWKAKAVSIGCDGKRAYDSTVIRPPIKRINRKAVFGRCPNCTTRVIRTRRAKIACKSCCIKFNHGKFDERYLFVWH